MKTWRERLEEMLQREDEAQKDDDEFVARAIERARRDRDRSNAMGKEREAVMEIAGAPVWRVRALVSF